MRTLFLLATLLLGGWNATCQPTVHISTPQASRVVDSLKVLPIVRKEAAAWQLSSRFYEQAADSLYKASELNLSAVRASERAFDGQVLLTANEHTKAVGWERKAKTRGLLNWLGAAVLGGAAYFFITH